MCGILVFIRGDSRDSRAGAGTAAECRGYKAEGLSRWRVDTEGAYEGFKMVTPT
jgi:hypothetical protein